MEMHHWARHARACPAHPRECISTSPKEERDGRDKTRHDEPQRLCSNMRWKAGNNSMRLRTVTAALAFVTLLVGAPSAQPAAAASYCPNPAHAKPAKVPPDLVAPVAKAFALEPGTLGAAFVRCVGPKLMGCMAGANLGLRQSRSAARAAWERPLCAARTRAQTSSRWRRPATPRSTNGPAAAATRCRQSPGEHRSARIHRQQLEGRALTRDQRVAPSRAAGARPIRRARPAGRRSAFRSPGR